MRLAIIPDLEYTKFEQIVDDLMASKNVYGVISTQYRKNLKKGFIWFWDSDYIPEELKQYVSAPPKPDKKSTPSQLILTDKPS